MNRDNKKNPHHNNLTSFRVHVEIMLSRTAYINVPQSSALFCSLSSVRHRTHSRVATGRKNGEDLRQADG